MVVGQLGAEGEVVWRRPALRSEVDCWSGNGRRMDRREASWGWVWRASLARRCGSGDGFGAFGGTFFVVRVVQWWWEGPLSVFDVGGAMVAVRGLAGGGRRRRLGLGLGGGVARAGLAE